MVAAINPCDVPGAGGDVLYVCTGCNFTQSRAEGAGERGGHVLWRALLAEAGRRGGAPLHLEPVACLNVCTPSCAAALVGPGKYTYVFGGQNPAHAAPALLDCAALYAGARFGRIDRQARPETLRRLVARVPPAGCDPDIDDDPVRNPRTAPQVPKPPRPPRA